MTVMNAREVVHGMMYFCEISLEDSKKAAINMIPYLTRGKHKIDRSLVRWAYRDVRSDMIDELYSRDVDEPMYDLYRLMCMDIRFWAMGKNEIKEFEADIGKVVM